MMMVSSFVAARLASDAAIIPSMLPPRCIVDARASWSKAFSTTQMLPSPPTAIP
jgi:hypothetical protein